MKSAFLSNMSHEIRTPLSGMLGMTTLLSLTELDGKQKEYLGNLKASGLLLLGIVNDILDLDRIESGARMPRMEPTDMVELCRNVLANVEVLAAEKGLRLESSYKGLDSELSTDRGMLGQILWKPLGNAVKFTPNGRISLDVSAVEQREGLAVLCISVSDTGIGIAPSDLGRIFERFSQVDNSYSKRYEGTGLGLHITRRLVELLEGTVEVRSTLGKGSVFIVKIPCAIGDEGVFSSRERRAEVEARPGGRKGKLILVAEDNQINLLYIETVLSEAGFRVIIADDGVKAIELLEKEVPDLILMDVQMPDMDGIECARRIRANTDPRLSSIPIVALTGYSMEKDRVRCLEAGMNSFLSKPFEDEELLEVVGKY